MHLLGTVLLVSVGLLVAPISIAPCTLFLEDWRLLVVGQYWLMTGWSTSPMPGLPDHAEALPP
jgi:hypothetical protein